MREVVTGVWHWQAPHPEWNPPQTWGRLVSSYAIDTGDDVLLFDPVGVPPELVERATAVVLTCPWHRRDAPSLGRPIWVPPPDPPDPDPVRGEVFRAGDTLPVGVRAFEDFEPNDLVLYVESRRAVVVGNTLIDRGRGLQLHPEWPVERAWELRDTVRTWDALHVALAEALGATLITLDATLGTVAGLEREIEVIGGPAP
jgi:hypothetical protein